MNINLRNLTEYLKKGGGIYIKEKNKGSFTKYCKGKVTQDCIHKAKKSGNKKLIKKAVFAENARKWSKKHQFGGNVTQQNNTDKMGLYQQFLNQQQAAYIQQVNKDMENAAEREAAMKKKIQSAQALGANIGNILGSIGGGLSMLAEDNEPDTTQHTIDPEVEQNVKDAVEQTNADILEQSKKQLESWKMDDAKVMESLKLPVINSDEILGNDFLEMLNKQKTK